MFFKDIVGHTQLKDQLIQMVREERVPHAQIVLGRSGSSKLALSLALISYLHCKDRQEMDSCGVCSACIKTHKYIHPDVHFVFPVVKKQGLKRDQTTSKNFLEEWRSLLKTNPYLNINIWQNAINAENGSPNINTTECNEIIHKLGLKAFESKYKTLLVWMPEYLGKEGNRLLKLIEEPPENTVIILVAQDQEKILNTILSRCQLIKTPPFSDDEIVSFLISYRKLDQTPAEHIARLSDGDMNKAISLSYDTFRNYSEQLLDWMRMSYKGDPIALGVIVNGLANGGREYQKYFLEYGLHFFREYLFWMLSGSDRIRLDEKEIEIAQKMRNIVDENKAEGIIHILQEGIHNVERNINPKIMFMAFSVEIGDLLRSRIESKKLFNI